MNITGIDDIATETQKSEGWSYFSIPNELIEGFDRDARLILNKSKLPAFHGKEFKRKKKDFYLEFFSLIKNTLSKSDNTLIACCILSEMWKNEYLSFCDRLITKSFEGANVNHRWLISSSSKLAAPLFSFMNLSHQNGTIKETTIEIDKDSVLRQFDEGELVIEGLHIHNSIPIYAAAKKYREKQFPQAPLIVKNGFNVVDDKDSFVVQAADMFGNYALSYATMCLGKDTKTNNLKAGIFAEAFPELAKPENSINHLVIERNEVLLKEDGAYTVQLSPAL